MQKRAGRPKSGAATNAVEEIQNLLESCSQEQRHQIFQQLRKEFPLHPLEAEWNAPAELILEAIMRAPIISQRGVYDLIAQAAFELYVVHNLQGWKSLPVPGRPAYDFLLSDEVGEVRIQLKVQRRIFDSAHTVKEAPATYRPMIAQEAARYLPADMYVVETQRTRSGQGSAGERARPYRFGEFDILAVSMHPSTNDWSSFMYTVARWLLPRREDDQLLREFQPVAMEPNDVWTDNFAACVGWLRSGIVRRVAPTS